MLWRHLGRQLHVQPPDLGTLRSIYDGRFDTLSDHQRFAQIIANFRVISEHQRRYVIRWLKEQLTGRPERGQLGNDLKQWFYEHRIVIPNERTIRQFIVQAVRDTESSLHAEFQRTFGPQKLDSWARLLPQPHKEHVSLQGWLWAVPLRGSTQQMGEVLDKINLLTMHGVACAWPGTCNDAIVRYYARRCASRSPSISKRIAPQSRRLEAACFMRYSLCTATDHILTMLRRWVQKVVNDASRTLDVANDKREDQLREFALAVKELANDESLTREQLGSAFCELADKVLCPPQSRRRLIRQYLIGKRHSARNLLMRIVQLPFEADSTHPVLDAIVLLRGLYRRHAYLLPDGLNIRLGRAWREAIDGYDRIKAMKAFEWATLFALRVALRNGSIYVEHMMSLETTRKVWQARADPRRRSASIGMYTHVLDRWGIFYDQPIVLNERQAGAAIEGVVRQNATRDIAQIAVDTHGYTDFAMGLARALGFDVCPRLSHLRDRRFHVPRDQEVPKELSAITDRDIRTDLIAEVWDEFVRIAASIRSGKCTAIEALIRFGSAARGQPVYDGGVQIGRLFRSIFLIDYFTNTSFRTELQHVLNRGEAVHAVQRAIHVARIPVELARREESLSAVSSALTLLSNILMAWNTTHMQHALEALQASGDKSLGAEQLRRIAPTHLEGINLRGTFIFPVGRYASRLLPSLTQDAKTLSVSQRA
ncbi:transposase Tn3 [Caballeronia calidae]|uniref:Transposase Tn3 n=1 Tax=Caballeronia calidae TaxID=1777139 RepID=A0A158EG63_9BURK|nr:transposase Tn3 [Caballeronia calidae]